MAAGEQQRVVDWEDVFSSHEGLLQLEQLSLPYQPTANCVQWLVRCPKLKACSFVPCEGLLFAAESVAFPVCTLFQSHSALAQWN